MFKKKFLKIYQADHLDNRDSKETGTLNKPFKNTREKKNQHYSCLSN